MKLASLISLRAARGDATVDELSDDALAAACATGDRAAQGLLFERHVDAIYRFIARMRTADADSVDDLVQATFIAAFKSADRFRGPKLQTWLFGIAANVLRAYVRKEIARKRITTSFGDEPKAESHERHDADVIAVRRAIEALPVKLREVIVLIDLEGQRGHEAAAALAISETKVWRRLAKARAEVRDQLARESGLR